MHRPGATTPLENRGGYPANPPRGTHLGNLEEEKTSVRTTMPVLRTAKNAKQIACGRVRAGCGRFLWTGCPKWPCGSPPAICFTHRGMYICCMLVCAGSDWESSLFPSLLARQQTCVSHLMCGQPWEQYSAAWQTTASHLEWYSADEGQPFGESYGVLRKLAGTRGKCPGPLRITQLPSRRLPSPAGDGKQATGGVSVAVHTGTTGVRPHTRTGKLVGWQTGQQWLFFLHPTAGGRSTYVRMYS